MKKAHLTPLMGVIAIVIVVALVFLLSPNAPEAQVEQMVVPQAAPAPALQDLTEVWVYVRERGSDDALPGSTVLVAAEHYAVRLNADAGGRAIFTDVPVGEVLVVVDSEGHDSHMRGYDAVQPSTPITVRLEID